MSKKDQEGDALIEMLVKRYTQLGELEDVVRFDLDRVLGIGASRARAPRCLRCVVLNEKLGSEKEHANRLERKKDHAARELREIDLHLMRECRCVSLNQCWRVLNAMRDKDEGDL